MGKNDINNVKIDGIIISVELPPYFISPDIEKGMKYYPTYVDKALAAEKAVRTPPSYLNDILRQVGSTGERREEILKHYSQYVGSQKVLRQMELAWEYFNLSKEQHLFIRITDRKQKTELHSLYMTKHIVQEKLLKGESIMLEPIEFKSNQHEEGSSNKRQ